MRFSSLTLLALISCSAILMVSVECKLKTQAQLGNKSEQNSFSAVEYKLVDYSSDQLKIVNSWPEKTDLFKIFRALPDEERRLLILALDNSIYLIYWQGPKSEKGKDNIEYLEKFVQIQANNQNIQYQVQISKRQDLTREYIKKHAKEI